MASILDFIIFSEHVKETDVPHSVIQYIGEISILTFSEKYPTLTENKASLKACVS